MATKKDIQTKLAVLGPVWGKDSNANAIVPNADPTFDPGIGAQPGGIVATSQFLGPRS